MNEKRLKEFWDKEYKKPELFEISEGVSSDLQKFTRWMQKENARCRQKARRSDVQIEKAG
jgi:hypothetical protein